MTFRLAFLKLFGSIAEIPDGDLLRAFYIGLKLDLRLAVTMVLPFLALATLPPLNPNRSIGARKFWALHFSILAMLLVFLFLADLGHYDYLATRLEASALRFLMNPVISLQMVWQTYAILPGILMIGLVGMIVYSAFRHVQGVVMTSEAQPRIGTRIVVGVAATILLIGGLYGKVSAYPLRWSDAYFSAMQFPADLATNPALRIVNTFATSESIVADSGRLRRNYDSLASYLNVEDPDANEVRLQRQVRPTPVAHERPNVVLIMMETFAAHLTGFHGNPLSPSPEFDRVAASGIAFDNFYTPGIGTAHGIFTMLTGIPDISLNRTASRNPNVIEQHMILNELDGYEKFYFLGGSANWANIRALLARNVEDLQIYEEGSYGDSPRTDVWGISDLHLFEETNKVLRETHEPFFAFVQLSGNHRPYTIPEDRRGFVWQEIDDDVALENGFDRAAGFNSFRFMDHALGFFMDLARSEPYFENTIFVLTADNGEIGRVPGVLHREEESRLSNYHAPFVIYGPALKAPPRRYETVGTQMDIMPTIAGAAGISATNKGLGRNLLDPGHQEGIAFIHRRWGGSNELLAYDGEYLMSRNGQDGHPKLARIVASSEDASTDEADRLEVLERFADSFFDASALLLFGE